MPETPEIKYVHICETCGVEKTMTSQEAYDDGWDYPPFMGEWGLVSPRTCGKCGIDTTLWWRMIILQQESPDATYVPNEAEVVLLTRILNEPESVMPPESKHNHDKYGMYANCEGCGTLLPPKEE